MQPEVPVKWLPVGYHAHVAALLTSRDRLPIWPPCTERTAEWLVALHVCRTCTTCRHVLGRVGRSSSAPGGAVCTPAAVYSGGLMRSDM